MKERVWRKEIEGKMEVNEGKDGKINSEGAERKGRQKERTEREKAILERRRRKGERVEK